MADSSSLSALRDRLARSSEAILESLSRASYTPPPQASDFCVKSALEALLSRGAAIESSAIAEDKLLTSIKDFALACALLSASESSTHDLLSWIPPTLSSTANSALGDLASAYVVCFGERNVKSLGELGVNIGIVSEVKRLVIELMPLVLSSLKDTIKESSIDTSDDADGVSAASARVPVGHAIVAAFQFRWFVTQVDYPNLGKLCNLVIPCALTALDHWSPAVKGQGMISFIHLARNVNAAELSWYEDVILDACCHNIASDDEIWCHVVEMSVLLVTFTQKSNPRSPWFEKILCEMLSHLERQPRSKERRVAWLKSIEPLLKGVGLVLLAHFRRIFPLIFRWMHADDDETVLLVLERAHTIVKLTWIRNTPYVERLVDELTVLYKEAALRRAREEIRIRVIQLLILLQQCKGSQFKAAWEKHRNDPNLVTLASSLSGTPELVLIDSGWTEKTGRLQWDDFILVDKTDHMFDQIAARLLFTYCSKLVP
ncbi:hypothetical protein CDL15_Pgr022554 [Punica granatum]|uniref:Uncharacterized protein n=1 Tax=Punica granatum TaxID=22663 RepID=A0A218XR75_PUNGR|nr:hypothetical protein CDL15_Pgr022554 [Punica granatum]